MSTGSPARRACYLPAVLFVVSAAAIALVAYRYYSGQKEAFEKQARDQLLTVADMKVREISDWLRERQGLARSMTRNRIVAAAVQQTIAHPEDRALRARVAEWLTIFCEYRGFSNAVLTDRAGRVLTSCGALMGDEEHFGERAQEVFQAGDVVFRDFHADYPSWPLHLGFNAPLRTSSDAEPVAALLLGANPNDYLYPLLQVWPTPSQSGETLLVRRSGDQVVSLSPLRHHPEASFQFRAPITQTSLPAVQAALGRQGVVSGEDYRGEPVLAAVRRVPGSSWFLVAKVDVSEIRGPLRRRGALLFIAVGALILAIGAGTAFLWWRQRLRVFEERYKAEVERRALIGHYDYLSRFANDIILLMDEEGRIVDCNERTLTVYGYSREELGEMHVRALRHPSVASFYETQWKAVDERGSTLFESLHQRKDGSVFPVEVSARLIEVQGKRYRQAIIRDITERKSMEKERQRLEQQLLESQKMESVGRLAGGVAHDFNNHLTVIAGYCELLQAKLDPKDPAAEMIAQIKMAGEHATRLTQQLLAFSRRQVLEPRTLNLNTVVSDTRRMLERLIGEDVELVTALASDLGSVHADLGQLNQILMNLAVNARDAMPNGGKIIIETANIELDSIYTDRHPELKPGPYVLLAFSDTGVGMDLEMQRRIFEPFFTTKPRGAGTGLGLSTVYGIVRQSGGWIWVYSEPGQGATFKIYFPRTEEPAREVPHVREAEPVSGGDETLLVVEDQDEVRRLTVTALRSYGYAVLEAANGEQALEECKRHNGKIDLLITDVVMPGMTGRDLAVRLSAVRPTVKVLYTSGYTANVIAHQGVLDPGVAYLPKPFTLQALAAKVREVLSGV